MTPSQDPTDAPYRFHTSRPTDLRRPVPGHRLAYIIWLLPRRLAALSRMLNVTQRGRVLDYGCADKPYRSMFGSDVEFVGADLPGNPQADVMISPDGRLPVADATFDAILSTQVLEHVSDPAVYLKECFRVLRPGGRLLLSTHGLMVYHPDPVDFWRWTHSGLQRIVEASGFTIVHAEGIMGLSAVGFQFLQDAIYFRAPNRLRRAVATVFQALAAMADRIDPNAGSFGNAMVLALVAEKPTRAQMNGPAQASSARP